MKPDEEKAEEFEGIVYKPCKCCGSLFYDLADGDVNDKGEYEPSFCDECFLDGIRNPNLVIH